MAWVGRRCGAVEGPAGRPAVRRRTGSVGVEAEPLESAFDVVGGDGAERAAVPLGGRLAHERSVDGTVGVGGFERDAEGTCHGAGKRGPAFGDVARADEDSVAGFVRRVLKEADDGAVVERPHGGGAAGVEGGQAGFAERDFAREASAEVGIVASAERVEHFGGGAPDEDEGGPEVGLVEEGSPGVEDECGAWVFPAPARAGDALDAVVDEVAGGTLEVGRPIQASGDSGVVAGGVGVHREAVGVEEAFVEVDEGFVFEVAVGVGLCGGDESVAHVDAAALEERGEQ